MGEKEKGWFARPLLAASLRLAIFLIPIAVATVAAVILSNVLFVPRSFSQALVWWGIFLVGTGLPALAFSIIAKRLLPLSVLLELTLLFPDEAPSRLEIARRAGRTRDLKKRLHAAKAHGLDNDVTKAAELVLALIASLGQHDRRTRGHSERVRAFADLLAEEAKVPASEREKLRWSALLHDIGKLEVDAAILNKPDKPDAHEWEIIRKHPLEGARLVAPLSDWMGPWAGAIEHHHERYDGKGYPRGLTGEEISLGGRILAIADSYECMTAARSYKKPLSAEEGRTELVREAGGQFDPHLVRAFMNVSIDRLWLAIGVGALIAQLPVVGPQLLRAFTGKVGAAVAKVGGSGAVIFGMASAGVVALPDGGAVPVAGVVAAQEGETGVPIVADDLAYDDQSLTEGSDSDATAPRHGTPSEPDDGYGGSTSPPGGSAPPPGGDAGPGPPPPPSDEPVSPYVAHGEIAAFNALASVRSGVTHSEFESNCGAGASQGADGWVFLVPDSHSRKGASSKVEGDSDAGSHDLDMYFYSSDCTSLGEVRSSANEQGALPPLARYVVVESVMGVSTDVTLTITL